MAFTNDHLMQVAPMRLRERRPSCRHPTIIRSRSAEPKRLRASIDGRVVADTIARSDPV